MKNNMKNIGNMKNNKMKNKNINIKNNSNMKNNGIEDILEGPWTPGNESSLQNITLVMCIFVYKKQDRRWRAVLRFQGVDPRLRTLDIKIIIKGENMYKTTTEMWGLRC